MVELVSLFGERKRRLVVGASQLQSLISLLTVNRLLPGAEESFREQPPQQAGIISRLTTATPTKENWTVPSLMLWTRRGEEAAPPQVRDVGIQPPIRS